MTETGDPEAPAGPAADDEVKAKFRAALDRKNHAAHDTASGAAREDAAGKAHGPHGAAGGKREFRRKAGG